MGCPHHPQNPDSTMDHGYLNWKQDVNYVFFYWWTAATKASFWGSIVVIFLLCVLYEGYIAARSVLETHIDARLNPEHVLYEHNKRKVALWHFAKAAAYAFQTFYAFFLMMVFMSYNGYFIVAMTLGFFTGHIMVSACLPRQPLIKPGCACH